MDKNNLIKWLDKCVNAYMNNFPNSDIRRINFNEGNNKLSFIHARNNKEVIICLIYIDVDLRNKGICKQFIQNCLANPNIDELCICGVQNMYLERILKQQSFICKGGDWIWTRHK